MKQSRQSLEQIFQAQVDNLSLTLQPFTVVKYQYVARYFVVIFVPNSPRSAGSRSFDAILICWAGFAGFASCVRPLATQRAGNVCSVFAGC